jgi:hypothetical protein
MEGEQKIVIKKNIEGFIKIIMQAYNFFIELC